MKYKIKDLNEEQDLEIEELTGEIPNYALQHIGRNGIIRHHSENGVLDYNAEIGHNGIFSVTLDNPEVLDHICIDAFLSGLYGIFKHDYGLSETEVRRILQDSKIDLTEEEYKKVDINEVQ